MLENNGLKSVIVVVYGQLDSTRKCIESIIRGTRNYEIIIWNNGEDNKEVTEPVTGYLWEISKGKKNIQIIHSKENIGFTQPCNEAVKQATGDYLCFVNNDIEVCTEWAEILINPMRVDNKIGESGIQGYSLDKYGKPYLKQGVPFDYVDGGLFVLTREAYNKVGLFDPNIYFAYCEDMELSIRLRYAKYSLNITPLCINHSRSTTRRSITNIDFKTMEENNRNYVLNKWKDFFSKQPEFIRGDSSEH